MQLSVQRAAMELHILIVDTDTSAAQVTRALVARAIPEGIVVVAPTFEHARLSIQTQHPDVLIIDPSPQTLEAARLIEQFKATRPNASVIVVASMPTPALRRTMAGLGVDVYLEKPAVLPLLRDELRRLVRPPLPTTTTSHV
jgi:DNA-binding NarL/FixJ family response regulator